MAKESNCRSQGGQGDGGGLFEAGACWEVSSRVLVSYSIFGIRATRGNLCGRVSV